MIRMQQTCISCSHNSPVQFQVINSGGEWGGMFCPTQSLRDPGCWRLCQLPKMSTVSLDVSISVSWKAKGAWSNPRESCMDYGTLLCSHIPLARDETHLAAREAGRHYLTGRPGRRGHGLWGATSCLCFILLLPVLLMADSPLVIGLASPRYFHEAKITMQGKLSKLTS